MPYEYLIIAIDDSDIVGYYLLTDAAMARADRVSDEESDGNDYWAFVSNPRRHGMLHFRNLSQLIPFLIAHGVKLKGEFGAITY